MERPTPQSNRFKWISRSVLVALGLVLLVVQVNKLLSSSFKIEIFGLDILSVEQLAPEAPAPPHPASTEVCGPASAAAAPGFEGAVAVAPRSEPATDDIFVVVEQMPELIGGLPGIMQKIRYPEIAKRAGVEGRVIVQFMVDERGCVSDPVVMRGIGAGCDEEALRVVREAWFRPGTQRGVPVKVKMSLPITFRLH
ncbi:MAG: energy transducer TonB [Rhodothermales bacterium]